jgi:hypothetical protein
MEYDNKTLNRHLMVPLNQKLLEVFDLIDYHTRFKLKLSSHAIDRMKERITKDNADRLGKLLKRIVNYGLCELLYFHTRYVNGEKIGRVEFVIDYLIVPVSFVGEWVVLRTIFIDAETRDESKIVKIDLSDQKFTQQGIK